MLSIVNCNLLYYLQFYTIGCPPPSTTATAATFYLPWPVPALPLPRRPGAGHLSCVDTPRQSRVSCQPTSQLLPPLYSQYDICCPPPSYFNINTFLTSPVQLTGIQATELSLQFRTERGWDVQRDLCTVYCVTLTTVQSLLMYDSCISIIISIISLNLTYVAFLHFVKTRINC